MTTAVHPRNVAEVPGNGEPPRVLALFGGMVMVAGLERMSFEVLRVLRDEGAALHCILNGWENHRIVPLVESVGGTWSTGSYGVRIGRPGNPVVGMRMALEIARVSRSMLRDAARFRPTHVFIPDYGTAITNGPALAILRARGVKVILRLANHPEPSSLYRFLFRYVLPRFVDLFVANSAFATRRVLDTGVARSRVRTIYNTLSTRGPTPDRPGGREDELLPLMRGTRTILSVGQIAPFKGTDLFVRMAIDIVARTPGTLALIVGRRPEWPPEYVSFIESLERSIAGAGLQDRIRFAGERETVLDLMREATVLVLPIVQEETFGNVALEALACGLPVVAFASGGLQELVDHERTGLLCAVGDLECLTAGVERLINDPGAVESARRASIEKYNAQSSPYSREAFVRAWSGIFRRNGKA